ncbi:MAG: hypothetical protein ACERKD_10850 [Prolixibacteraceae bacterium]
MLYTGIDSRGECFWCKKFIDKEVDRCDGVVNETSLLHIYNALGENVYQQIIQDA